MVLGYYFSYLILFRLNNASFCLIKNVTKTYRVDIWLHAILISVSYVWHIKSMLFIQSKRPSFAPI